MSDLKKNSLGDSHQFDSIAMKQHLQREEYLQNFVSIDLEVSPKSGRIEKLAAVRASTDQYITYKVKDLAQDLARLDEFVDGASFILGHNIIEHDIPHIKAANPNLRLLRLPVIDTLRLSPLAFPKNPYHRLVKHYKDGGLIRSQLNDPKLDADISKGLFHDEFKQLRNASPDILTAWHWLTTNQSSVSDSALDEFFTCLRAAPRPTEDDARSAIQRRLDGNACINPSLAILSSSEFGCWGMAYALAWLSVAGDNSIAVSGGNSTMPPWVRHQFPSAERLINQLRNFNCRSSSCSWCNENHDALKLLRRWFEHSEFRAEPVDKDGNSLQQLIIEKSMEGENLLALLPTGAGKSLCYQLPAVSRYHKTGALTVVISPLVALMADQIKGMEEIGIGCCATINSLLSMPERSEALNRVRLGEVGILLISPEQLRSTPVIRALDQRQIGGWVLDEAHCISKWGHDFRPDYRYVGRYIKKGSKTGNIPPITCLTATARPEVAREIVDHFQEWLGKDLQVIDGGADRPNLFFEVIPTSSNTKNTEILSVLEAYLPSNLPGGAIVYCATQKQTESVAEFLHLNGISSHHFHAGLSPEVKKEVQHRFVSKDGDLRVIVATNAFGMGIDKPDVRLVVHADIPGSLENYLQEAGRAGRDRDNAHCVLLFNLDDAERQFGMAARSRLTQYQIQSVLRAIRNIKRKEKKNRRDDDIFATSGEILDEDEEKSIVRDSITDDTRVKTAVAWLEESKLVTREENYVQIYPSSLRVNSIDEARKQLGSNSLDQSYRNKLLAIVEALVTADPTESITTDDLKFLTGLNREGVRDALFDLERFGISTNDAKLTAFVHLGGEHSSQKRLQQSAALEIELISHMRELAPQQGKRESSILHLRNASQFLRNKGFKNPLPEKLWRIIRSLSYDGRSESNRTGSLSVQKLDLESCRVTLQREWQELDKAAEQRRQAASQLLGHLLDCLPPEETRGVDRLAETTVGELHQAIESDFFLRAEVQNRVKLLERALLWLHEQEVIRLNKGLVVFRPAMKINITEKNWRRGFTKIDFKPLEFHYGAQVKQVHIIIKYAELGISEMSDALRLAMDYFYLSERDFLRRWFANSDKNLYRQTTPESWQKIVENLRNTTQQQIVANEQENTNILVLAGPGSGKTRVLVHRIAYLVRVMREDPRGIVALAYNRHSAIDIRKRLDELIDSDGRSVTVLTCHALAMRLAGFSFNSPTEQPDEEKFNKVIKQAVDVLRGKGLEPEDAEEQRARLLAGFRWILVDEYQDINSEQYELISALAGRTLEDKSRKLNLFAVGDDDQNIYAFRNTSVEFIRQFQRDYGPRPMYLTENYRSSSHIISAANTVIESARDRMKVDQPIQINSARSKEPLGGAWQELDPVSKGRVQILTANQDSQALIAISELKRLSELNSDWDWSKCAVIARQWTYLYAARSICESYSENETIPVQMGNEDFSIFWHLRETQNFIMELQYKKVRTIGGDTLRGLIDLGYPNRWKELLRQAVEEFVAEFSEAETTVNHFIQWLADWGREFRRRQRGLLLVTAHRAKGLEFDHVVVLDGGWNEIRNGGDPDESRRLYYVAMTRARKTLSLINFEKNHKFQKDLHNRSFVLQRHVCNVGNKVVQAQQVQKRELGLRDVNLGFTGLFAPSNRIHKTIATLNTGDSLRIQYDGKGPLQLLTLKGVLVGRLAKNYSHPPGMRCIAATILAIVNWRSEYSNVELRKSMKCDEWEVVIPELIYEREE